METFEAKRFYSVYILTKRVLWMLSYVGTACNASINVIIKTQKYRDLLELQLAELLNADDKDQSVLQRDLESCNVLYVIIKCFNSK